MMHEKVNQTLVDSRKTLLALLESKAQLTKFAFEEHAGSDERRSILNVLNFQEFVAAGIREKAFDEPMYKRIQFSVVTRDWNVCKGFIMELRKSRNRPTLFQEFQWLAERWLADRLKVA